MMEKLIVIAGLGQNLYSRWRLQRLFSAMIIMAILTIITSTMISALLIGGIYAAYFTLLHYGIDYYIIVLVFAAIALAITGMLVMAIQVRLRPLLRKSPVSNQAGEAIDAFLNGLLYD